MNSPGVKPETTPPLLGLQPRGTPGPTQRPFKPRASSTPFLAGELRRAHRALHPALRSARRPHCAGRIVWAGALGVRTLPRRSALPWRVSGGRAGTWRPGRRTCRDRGRRPGAPASRWPEAGGRDGSLNPGREGRVREAPGRGGGGGGRTEGGGIRGAGGGGGAGEPPGCRERPPRGV